MSESLAEIAARVGGTVLGDGGVAIDGIAAIDDATETTLTFATDERYLRAALASRAAAVLTERPLAEGAGAARKPLLIVPSARVTLAAMLGRTGAGAAAQDRAAIPAPSSIRAPPWASAP